MGLQAGMQRLQYVMAGVTLLLAGGMLLCGCGPATEFSQAGPPVVSKTTAENETQKAASPALPTKTESFATKTIEAGKSESLTDQAVKPASDFKPTESKPDPNAKTADSQPAELPGGFRLLIKEKSFKKEKDGVLRLTYDDIDLEKILGMKKVVPTAPQLMPDWLKGLEGKQVRLRGFMYPTFEAEGIRKFVFCRDTGACCFGPNPTIYYLVLVTMADGKSTHYIENRPFDVVGTFHIKLSQIEGTDKISELYQIDNATVIER